MFCEVVDCRLKESGVQVEGSLISGLYVALKCGQFFFSSVIMLFLIFIVGSVLLTY